MQTIRLRFCDFHRRLPQSLEYFQQLLKRNYIIDQSSPPDFVLYSNYGRQHRQYDCTRIFYSMENERPDFTACDFAFTFDYSGDPRHYRLPYYLVHSDLTPLLPRTVDRQTLLATKQKFCCFVHSNPFGAARNRLFTRLSEYKQVVSGGRYRNNLGHHVTNKLAFMQAFKFAFAFENDAQPGYTTEKLTDAFLAGTIPIYWGNERVTDEFNPRSFLNRHEFASEQALIDRIVEIDQNDDLLFEYLGEPAFQGNRLPAEFSDERVLAQFARIFATSQAPVAGCHKRWIRCTRHIRPPAVARRMRRFARHSVKGLRLATGL